MGLRRATVQGRTRTTAAVAALGLSSLAAGLAAAALGLAAAVMTPAARAASLSFTIDSTPASRLGSTGTVAPIPQGFLGTSIDYCSITQYVDGQGSDRVLANLLGAIAGGRALLRVGGNGPEAPCPGRVKHPASTAINAIGAVQRLLGGGLILGIDLEAHRLRKAYHEARVLVGGLDPRRGHPHIAAFEIGNEPDRYRRYGGNLPRRKLAPYFISYLRDFTRWAAAVRQAAHDQQMPIAGPGLGRLGLPWIRSPTAGNFNSFVNSAARPKYLTFHRYPLRGVGAACPSELCPTMQNLLSDHASHDLAGALAPFVMRTPPGRVLRIDEINSITNGGTNGVSNTFAAALWALDATFEMAHLGAAGVNYHTFSDAAYALFSHTRSHGWVVHPEYYGLLMFARSAPSGSRLLGVRSPALQPGSANVKVWATRGRDRVTRVLVINKDIAAHQLALSGSGLPQKATASLQLLNAAPIGAGSNCPRGYAATGLCAFGEVALGGRAFGPIQVQSPAGDSTSTGMLAAPSGTCWPPLPADCKTTLSSAGTTITVPAASALLLTSS